MNRSVLRVGAVVLGVAALWALPQAAQAGSGPLSPAKYHTTGGDFENEHPSSGVKAFVLTFDELSPEGRNTVFQGYVGAQAFAGWTAMITRDAETSHTVWAFNAVLTDNGGSPVPLVGTLDVTYERDGEVRTVSVRGTKDGEPFFVKEMPVQL